MDKHLKEDAWIEDALKSQTLAPMPRSITADVMARIQKSPAPRFRLTRNDYVLAVVLALTVGAVFFAMQSLPGHTLLQLRILGILLWQKFLVNARWLVPTLLFGLAALLAGLTIPALIQMTTNRQR